MAHDDCQGNVVVGAQSPDYASIGARSSARRSGSRSSAKPTTTRSWPDSRNYAPSVAARLAATCFRDSCAAANAAHRSIHKRGKQPDATSCLTGPDHGGCGRLSIVAAPLEQLVTDAVLYRLDSPQLASALSGRAAQDQHAAELADAIAADRQQLDELAALYADKTISAREWLAARNPIEARINDNERRVARLTRSDALAGVVGNGKQLGRQWAKLDLAKPRSSPPSSITSPSPQASAESEKSTPTASTPPGVSSFSSRCRRCASPQVEGWQATLSQATRRIA